MLKDSGQQKWELVNFWRILYGAVGSIQWLKDFTMGKKTHLSFKSKLNFSFPYLLTQTPMRKCPHLCLLKPSQFAFPLPESRGLLSYLWWLLPRVLTPTILPSQQQLPNTQFYHVQGHLASHCIRDKSWQRPAGGVSPAPHLSVQIILTVHQNCIVRSLPSSSKSNSKALGGCHLKMMCTRFTLFLHRAKSHIDTALKGRPWMLQKLAFPWLYVSHFFMLH